MPQEPLLPSIQTRTTPKPAPNGLGRGLFATTDFRTGDDVLHIQGPFVAVLDTQRLEDTCSGCFGKKQLEAESENGVDAKACSGCQVVKYCDKSCQAKDWKSGHSMECAIYKKLKPKILPNNARAVLRMVLRTAAKKNAYAPQEMELFYQLETHIREIREKNHAHWERISLSSMAVKEYSGTDMKLELISAFSARLDLNSFNLTTSVYDRVGLYLHPYAAIVNHSCEFNSVVGFDGPELYIKAIRPIGRGDQIFISYVDATSPPRIRRRELRERYFFDCHCERCSSENAQGQEAEIGDVAKDAYGLLESGSASNNVEKLMDTMNSLILHPWPITKQPLVSTLDALIAAMITAGDLKAALPLVALRYLYIDPVVYPSEAHPLRIVHAWTMARLAIHFTQTERETALQVLGEVGDDGSPAVSEVRVNLGPIVWSVLNGLAAKIDGSCAVPGLKGMVKRAFAHTHLVCRSRGIDPGLMRKESEAEWVKLHRAVRSVLGEKVIPEGVITFGD
ncbi:S-adenosylmethionine-dependent methyltransferase [Aspergillus lucknowensis]|uniref:Suppressor of anucleate metulae protein B n=1 Tax=Aspergillus lucknowensis TaxID=176173 RepID=A0ABR4M748_9EURO